MKFSAHAPLNDPAEVVAAALDGLEAGQTEVIADRLTAAAKAALASVPPDPFTGHEDGLS